MPDMTISFTAQQAQRMQEAFATSENPTPSMGDLKTWVIRQIRAQVLRKERAAAEAQISDSPFDPT